MGLGIFTARRLAIVAALAGGFVIAVAGAGLCAKGVVWGGAACLEAFRSALTSFGL